MDSWIHGFMDSCEPLNLLSYNLFVRHLAMESRMSMTVVKPTIWFVSTSSVGILNALIHL